MAVCGCGAESAHVRIFFDAKGKTREECRACHPENFQEPFDATNRIVSGPEAMPNMYTKDSDGVYRAKDELLADTVAMWDKGPTEQAKEHKRANRRTAPLTQDEIDASVRWGNEVLRPHLQSN